MRKFFSLLTALALSALTLLPPPALAQEFPRPPDSQDHSAAAGKGGKFRRTERALVERYIVVLKDDVADVRAAAAGLARSHRGVTRHIYEHTIKGFSVRMSEEAAIRLSQHPLVEFVEEDGEVTAAGSQGGATWGLDRIDQRFMPLNGTYTYNRVGSGTHAYVIDSGIRPTHKEFGTRARAVFDAFGGNGLDCNGHGTHVAGTIAGRTYGVAKNARLFAVRVLDCANRGTNSGVIAGVDWVTFNHIKPAVANMSLGGSASDSLDTAVRRSISAGVTYVIAAGNESNDAIFFSPARVAEAITVGATDSGDFRAGFSNFGSVLDLFAPGVFITSAWWDSDTATNTISGTSMAAPHVAGVAAQYLEFNPGAFPSTVASAIINNSTFNVVGNPGPGSPNRLLFSGFVPAPATNPIDDNRFFARQQYFDVLSRDPDQGGLDAWTNYINGCGGDPACLNARRITTARGFLESWEFRNQVTALRDNPPGTPAYNAEYVRQLYIRYLQRDPDDGGFNAWLNYINSTGNYDELVGGFINSTEYRNRFL